MPVLAIYIMIRHHISGTNTAWTDINAYTYA